MAKNTGVLDLVTKDTQSVTSSKSSNSSNKTAPSLFDSMLLEANKAQESFTSKEINSTKVEKTQNAEKTENSEKAEPQKTNEEQKTDNKTKDETAIEPKKEETAKQENIKTDTSKQDTQANTEQSSIKNQNPSSLLDRLIHEAKTQIQKESVETQIKDTTLLNDKVITEQTVTKELTTKDTKNSLVQTQVTTTTKNIVSEDNLDLLNLDKKQQNQSSLMDRLLEEAKSLNTNLTNEVELDETTQKLPTQAVVSNIYLSSLNKASADAMLGYVHEAKNLVSNANSIKDVQKGADLLNLGLQDSEVTVEDSEFNQNVKNDFLNKLSISKDVVKYDIAKMSQEMQTQTNKEVNTTTTITSSLTPFSSATDIDITVPSNLAFNIENRIIGAQQQMNSMMSDIARNMYLNYKPPITAFRMNLNPGHLGSISVLMRSDKDSGLSISLNMSNAATLDSFVDNQSTLRAALAKNFNTTENISLEFNMQDGQQQNQEQQNRKNSNKSNENHQATNDILENISQEIETSPKVANYM